MAIRRKKPEERLYKSSCGKRAPCISLVGMPGAGKTTIGRLLAQKLGWAFMDSDNLIEALYGARLQDIADYLDKEAFLDMESAMICNIQASRCVIATGGSVVYRPEAIAHLKSLGPVARLALPLDQIKERIAQNPERGIAIAPGQTLEDLYEERDRLYKMASSLSCSTGDKTPQECAEHIFQRLPEEIKKYSRKSG